MSKKKKILQSFWGEFNAGGAETMMVNIFKKTNTDLFDVSFLTYDSEEYFYNQTIRDNGGKMVALTDRQPRFIIKRIFSRWKRLYRLFKQENYDVFYCNCDFSFKFIEMFLAKKAGIRVRVAHSHSTSLETDNFKGKISFALHKVFRPLLVRYTTDYVACSEGAAKWLFGKKVKNAVIINNGIDSEYYQFDEKTRAEYREKLKLKDSIALGHVGRFFWVKNQKFLIDIAKEAKTKGIDIKILLIGEGELKVECVEYARAMGVEDKVLFVGTTDKVRDYLMAFDCFVMPSFFEGVPVSGIEAQATGLPCVMSDKISRDLDITGNLRFLSLDLGAKDWLDNIIDFCGSFTRINTRDHIIDAGYDIMNAVKDIERIYGK